MNLSAALIVRNEAENIERCLSSLVPHVREIVILDTGSTDNTVECAHRFTDRIFHSELFTSESDPNEFHFGHARNELLFHCTSDWILSIDADEILQFNDEPTLSGGRAQNIWIRTMRFGDSMIPGNHCWQRVPRVFPRANTQWHGRCHEMPCPYHGNLCISKASMHIEHRTSSGRKRSSERNLILLKRQLSELNNDQDWWPNETHWRLKTIVEIGDTYRELRQWLEAIGNYQLVFDVLRNKSDFRSVLAYKIAVCYFHAGWISQAFVQASEAIRLNKDRIEPYFYIVCALMALKKYQEARKWLTKLRGLDHPIRLAPSDDDGKVENEWLQRMEAKLKTF